MSDNWLKYIPTDPEFIPTASAAANAERLLASFVPLADKVRSEFPGSVRFFDPGANWSGVECSACGADAQSWWNDAMDRAAQTHFRDLRIVTRCCGASLSLNELRYPWAAGFASFALKAMNPNIKTLPADQLKQLAAILGCSLREIAVHL
jgi:hypothetical protein